MTTGRALDIVVTSIGSGEFVPAYADMIEAADRVSDARLVVIPDRKTPTALYDECRAAAARGIDVVCPTPDEQVRLLERLGADNLVPWNSDNRRNIGFLLSLQGEAELIISVDDDNYPLDGSFISEHESVVADAREHDVVSSASGWWNPCATLRTDPAVMIYPRGFPYAHRHAADLTVERSRARVRLNTGLWERDPDVDAVTRLALAPRVEHAPRTAHVVSRDTWTPLNSQNTGVHRDAIPSYYFIRMGYTIGGLAIDRFGDIFSGYFALKCAKHLGDTLRVGLPVVDHRRNAHTVVDDLRQELPAIQVIEDICDWLVDVPLTGSTYSSTYVALSEALDEAAESFSGSIWTDGARGFLHETACLMRAWTTAAARAAS